MKKLLLTAILIFGSLNLIAQTDGMSYQAVIISPNAQEIPGVDVTGNILPNKSLAVRFTISDSNGSIEFQESHTTTTDAYGMINLVIGQGSSSIGSFTEIVWDGTQKDLKVEINLDGSYKDLSKQSLLFTPYAFHRDIIATGDLTVGGEIGFSGDLEVDGATILNNTLLVANGTSTNLTGILNVEGKATLKDALVVANTSPSELSGKLTVLGATELNNTLDVSGATGIKNSLTVSGQHPTALTGTLVVDGVTNLNNTLNVTNGSPVNLSGDLKIGGVLELGNDLTVNGITNLNKELKVNNQSPTLLTGQLDVDGSTALKNELQVTGVTKLNNALTVTNESPTSLTGTLTVEKETALNNALTVTNESPTNLTGTLTVEKETALNNALTVTNESPTNLTGTLTVEKETTLNNALTVTNESPTNLTGTLTVEKETTLNNALTVTNESPTNLTGTLTVDKEALLNKALTVTNESPTNLTGTLTVDGATIFNNTLAVKGSFILGDDLKVNGTTNLNSSLSVNNGSPTNLTGILNVDGATTLNNTLEVTGKSATNLTGTLNVDGETDINERLTVNGPTYLNNTLLVAPSVSTFLMGGLRVYEGTELNNLTVINAKPTILTGSLNVAGKTGFGGDLIIDGTTTLNKSLTVANASATTLTGLLGVDGATDLNSTLTVDGATDLNSTLTVDGATDLNTTLNVDGATTINNSLTVTGTTTLEDLDIKSINVTSDNADFVATLENLNTVNGDGLLIKLGRTHGAWNGGSYLNIQNPVLSAFDGPLNTVKGWLSGGNFTPTQLFDLMPATFIAGAMAQIGNGIIGSINDGMGLPYSFPAITVPETIVWSEYTIVDGGSWTTPQACTEICDPTPLDLGCATICIPPWSVTLTLPRIYIPGFTIPEIPILPAIPNVIPRIPTIPTGGLPSLAIPNFTVSVVSNSLSKENKYITFQDKDGRTTGSIRAQSTKDFRDNTVLDNVYLLNVMSSFVGIDLLDGITSGTVEISNLVDSFNKIGVEYSSGNGDYAEWLERMDQNEYLTAGDIVAVKGGKITRDLNNVEQIMVVSHKPIILGNAPEKGQDYKGNNIAFMGQVPVKVMGAVSTGDYIVASSEIKGYGIAKHPEDMMAEDFTLAVGRSWENRATEGPKMVNTVVGVHYGDWKLQVEKIQQQQQQLDEKIESLDAKLDRIAENIEIAKLNKTNYVSKN